MVLADFRRIGLPSWREFINEDNVMRIAHRDWGSAHLAKCHFDGELVPDLRFAHSRLELKFLFALRGQHTRLDSRPGSDPHLLPRSLRTQIGGDATRAIARDFRVGTVSINQSGANVRVLRWKQPLYAVGANSVVAMTNAPAECAEVRGHVHAVNDQKIIAASARLCERYCRTTHSLCTGPSTATLSNAPDSFSPFRTRVWCLRVPSHSKWIRTWRGVGANCVFSIRE